MGIPENRIRFMEVVSASSRRKRRANGYVLNIKLEISDPPPSRTEGNATTQNLTGKGIDQRSLIIIFPQHGFIS